jgi:hypothetical protein
VKPTPWPQHVQKKNNIATTPFYLLNGSVHFSDEVDLSVEQTGSFHFFHCYFMSLPGVFSQQPSDGAKVLSLTARPSTIRSCAASSPTILPTFSLTSSITLSIKLKGHTANWNRVTHKAATIRRSSLVSCYVMTTVKHILMINWNSPQA